MRDAFRKLNHEAYSVDLQPSRGDSAYHITGDLFVAMEKHGPWDMLIAFPPCTHVAVSGARWFKNRMGQQRAALEFMRDVMHQHIGRIAMENPVGVFSTFWRKPDQIIQPWQFGHGETKATCLWLKNLPLLVPTKVVEGRANNIHRMAPGPMRTRNRSVTFPGIASAMAEQWGALSS